MNLITKRHTPLLTVDCVITTTEGVVAIKRLRPPFENCYALPGGFVNVGESVEEACAREVFEETGLRVESLRLIGVYSSPDRDPRQHVVSVAFSGIADVSELRAGDDAASVHILTDWKSNELAFDHSKIMEDFTALDTKI